jgi:hypothetical protein
MTEKFAHLIPASLREQADVERHSFLADAGVQPAQAARIPDIGTLTEAVQDFLGNYLRDALLDHFPPDVIRDIERREQDGIIDEAYAPENAEMYLTPLQKKRIMESEVFEHFGTFISMIMICAGNEGLRNEDTVLSGLDLGEVFEAVIETYRDFCAGIVSAAQKPLEARNPVEMALSTLFPLDAPYEPARRLPKPPSKRHDF